MSMYPHERLLHILSALLIEVHALQTLVQPADQRGKLDADAVGTGLLDLQTLACEALALVRSSLSDVPIPELDGVTLAEALSRLVEETAEGLGLASRISFTGGDEHNQPVKGNLSPVIDPLLYLVAREALYQVAQHRDARRLRFAFHYRQDDVQMSLEDDGIPGSSDTSSVQEHKQQDTLNVQSVSDDTLLTPIMYDLRCRLEQLGGSLHVESVTPRGVRVRVSIPYSLCVSEVDYFSETSLPVVVPAASQPEVTGADHVTILIVDSMAVTLGGPASFIRNVSWSLRYW